MYVLPLLIACLETHWFISQRRMEFSLRMLKTLHLLSWRTSLQCIYTILTHLIVGYRRAKELNVPLRDDFLQMFSDAPSKELFLRLQNIFHLCISISPLIALTSRQFSTWSVGRMHMLKVRSTLMVRMISRH